MKSTWASRSLPKVAGSLGSMKRNDCGPARARDRACDSGGSVSCVGDGDSSARLTGGLAGPKEAQFHRVRAPSCAAESLGDNLRLQRVDRLRADARGSPEGGAAASTRHTSLQNGLRGNTTPFQEHRETRRRRAATKRAGPISAARSPGHNFQTIVEFDLLAPASADSFADSTLASTAPPPHCLPRPCTRPRAAPRSRQAARVSSLRSRAGIQRAFNPIAPFAASVSAGRTPAGVALTVARRASRKACLHTDSTTKIGSRPVWKRRSIGMKRRCTRRVCPRVAPESGPAWTVREDLVAEIRIAAFIHVAALAGFLHQHEIGKGHMLKQRRFAAPINHASIAASLPSRAARLGGSTTIEQKAAH